MRLYFQNGVFALATTYDERAIPKAAGFYWHGDRCLPKCKACAGGLGKGIWWAYDPSKAARLVSSASDNSGALLDVEPSAEAALTETVESLKASRATDAEVNVPLPNGQALLPYQRAGVAYCMTHERVLLGDEMGLGKTVQAIAAVNGDLTLHRILIVCPASLILNWERELKAWLARPMAIHKRIFGMQGVSIVSYQDAVKGMKVGLGVQQWDMLIVDEGHYLKSPRSQRTRAMLGHDDRKTHVHTPGLVDRARRVLILTGTPLPNRPIELWPLLHALAPTKFANFFTFAKRFCAAYEGRFGWDFSGASNLEDLQWQMRSTCLIRRAKRDVLADLPPKRRQIIVLDPHDNASVEKLLAKERELAAQAEAEIEADEYADDAAKLRSPRYAFSEISKVRHDLALAKVASVVDHVDALLNEGVDKVILFAHHKDVIAKLAEGLKAYGVVTLTGETPMADRQIAVDAFQANPGVRVFIGSITAAGVGLTLTASSTVVFAELDWTPANVQQAEDRAHRIGQHDSVNVYHLVYDGSLDARMAKILVEKQEVADRALDKVPEAIEFMRSEMRPPAPVPSDVQRKQAHQAMRSLASHCDGALLKDGAGFNRYDTNIGKKLARLDKLTDRQTWLALRIAKKYQKQLDNMKDAC